MSRIKRHRPVKKRTQNFDHWSLIPSYRCLEAELNLNSVRFNRFSEWRSLRRAIANLIAKLREIKSRRNSSGKANSINPICQGSGQPKKIPLSRAPSAVEIKCAYEIMKVRAFKIKNPVPKPRRKVPCQNRTHCLRSRGGAPDRSAKSPVAKLRCDRGTNFIGGRTELDNALREMGHRATKRYVTEEGCEWLLNPPHASHFDGVWERQIGTIRRILDSMLLKDGRQQLTHELLGTLMAEVSAIVNARPIASLPTCTDHPQPLSPAMLLTIKTRPLLSPPGVFVSQDLYSGRYWRRVQYLADQFWIRWKHEYLQALQSISKWNDQPPNLEVGDIVIVKDQTPRNHWPMGKIVDPIKSKDDKVRIAEVALWKDGGIKKYLRPVNELVLFIRSKTQ